MSAKEQLLKIMEEIKNLSDDVEVKVSSVDLSKMPKEKADKVLRFLKSLDKSKTIRELVAEWSEKDGSKFIDEYAQLINKWIKTDVEAAILLYTLQTAVCATFMAAQDDTDLMVRCIKDCVGDFVEAHEKEEEDEPKAKRTAS